MKNKIKLKNIFGIIFIVLSYVTLFLAIKYISIIRFSYDLLLLATMGISFVSLHFFLDIKKIYEFIYKKRYLLAIGLLIFVTIMGYSGSSIGMWNRYVQPNIEVKNGEPIIGLSRGVRSDEWMVGTPTNLSQQYVNYSTTNNLMMAKDNNVLLYPALPNYSITTLGKLANLPYLFLPAKNATALNWYGRLVALFLMSFELCMIITNKKKLYSLMGACLIAFSPANMWWYSIDMLLYGNAAIVILYLFVKEKKVCKKLLFSTLFGLVGVNYILLVYPAWQVPFGFIYLALLLWILIVNKKYLRWKDLLYLFVAIAVILAILIPTLISGWSVFELVNNTVYPGSRLVTGGGTWERLYNYIVSISLSFKNVGNPSEFSNFIGFYPIPIILGIYYMIKNKKIDCFLILVGAFTIFLSIWNYIDLGPTLVKLTLLSFSIPERSQIVVGYGCILLLVYLLGNRENIKNISKKEYIIGFIISIIIYIVTMLIVNRIVADYISKPIVFICTLMFIPLFAMIVLNNKKLNKYLAIFLIIISLFIGFTVNPITKGLSVLYEKPFAKEIQKIVKEDPEAVWVTMDSGVVINNYVLTNGAKIINSTNFYPNLELWHKFDSTREYNYVYNRYAHIDFVVVDEKTSFVLNQADHFTVKININDVCGLGAKYVVSLNDLTQYNNESVIFEKLYEEDGININKLICQ